MFLSLFGVIYPSKREDTKFFDYCYSLEKILFRQSLESRKNLPNNLKSITKDISKFGVTKTKGSFIKKTIDQYKDSKNSFLITLFPNELICLAGYWLENTNPGKLESIFYEKTKQKINDFEDMKNDVEEFLQDINSEYKTIKKEFNSFF